MKDWVVIWEGTGEPPEALKEVDIYVIKSTEDLARCN